MSSRRAAYRWKRGSASRVAAHGDRSGKGGDVADRGTPLVRNEWYVAALGHEITRTPLRRTILEQDIVFYRCEDGSAAALQNRCAHRSYPLSKGCLNGDAIVCGYHGMEFGADGRCVHIPAQDAIPAAMRVQAYPLVEQGPFVWIWTGDPDAADMEKLVPQPWFTEPDWGKVAGYFHMKASYLGLHENLLDLSHFPFVHGAALGRAEHAGAKPRVGMADGLVHSSVLHRDIAISPAFAAAAPMMHPVDRLSEQVVPTPAIHLGKAIYTDSSDPPQVFNRYVVHFPTPETRTSTHYFWGIARDTAIDDAAMDAEALALGNKAFNEDREVLEEIEALVARDDRPEFREKIIDTDRGGILFLRWLAARAAAEQGAPEQQAKP